MINLTTCDGLNAGTLGAIPSGVDRPANHNLTRAARRSNVVLIGGRHPAPDFRPDLGARLAFAA
ncbi:hypothetical protein [Celeribacter indicus]|uniref:Uncharacterized protein n=1 Tax=Celeribacter indicus TaxID=1208324 RepID=A0A0B5DNT2_9RHOB|nr:hypothetical protein [Celeribacter indicus]AJE45238.1 hypothetical protein P73_0523 [Celeribacter indicus]SDX21780.1 hypothetical protein SAMN05443573_117104 [Celeribacter indicus]